MDQAHWTVDVTEDVELPRESGASLLVPAGRHGLREVDPTRYALLRDGQPIAVLWFSEVLTLQRAGRMRIDGDWPILPRK